MDYLYIVYAVLVLGGIGLIFGVILTAAHKKLSVKVDERLPVIRGMLGGANCGACGFAGCDAFAAALLSGEAKPEQCSVISSDSLAAIGGVLGVEVDETEPMAARVLCTGRAGVAGKRYEYEGFSSCRVAAAMAGGPKLCNYSCIGLGDCVSACAFDGIRIEEGLCVIDAEACKGCGECARVCPRGVISLLPRRQLSLVRCRNEMTARLAKSVCQNACIGCGRCKKNCEADAIIIENGYARIDPNKCTGCGVCVPLCPSACIELTITST